MPETTEEAVYEPSGKMKVTVEKHASGYSLTMLEACEILSRCPKTLSRYIHKGKITPQRIKSHQGTIEYRFRKEDIEVLRSNLREQMPILTDSTIRENGNGQGDNNGEDVLSPHKQTEQINSRQSDHRNRQAKQDMEIESVLKKNVQFLKEQIAVKDSQISALLERDREKNMLLKGLQDKVLLLDPPKESFVEAKTGQKKQELIRQTVEGILLLILIGYICLSHGGIK